MLESLVTRKYFGTGQFPGHALADIVDRRLLAVSYYADTVLALQSCELNTRTVMKVNQSPNLLPRDFDNTVPWLYVWSGELYDREPVRIYADSDQARWILINEKAAALDQIHQGIQMHRRAFQRDLLFQQATYEFKIQDARAFKLNPSIDPDSVPFLRDYAQLLAVDLDYAANAIILQHDIFKSRLADSEALRVKYTLAIRQSSGITEVQQLVKEFQKECFVYGKI